MKHKNSTKRTLALSLLVMLLCVAMLVGTTFAWFTDSASTAVNKIQAGTLDVQLLDEQGASLEGLTLAWQKAAENEDVLWEPGCTYNLQPIVIKNAGNLALKYKIQITGIQGDAELNNAIEWTITNTSANTSATTALDADHSLAAGASDTLTISGHMKEEAGNEYQGLSIEGIAITVVATQDTVEFDSNNNTYDKDAAYPQPVSDATGLSNAMSTVGSNIVITAANNTLTFGNNTSIATDVSVDLGGTTQTIANSIKAEDGQNLSMSNGELVKSGTFGKIRMDTVSGEQVCTFENMTFTDTEAPSHIGSASNDTEEMIQICPRTGTGKYVFRNCTFNNAMVNIAGLSSSTGNIEVVFEGCTFNNTGNATAIAINSNYLTGSLTVKDCTFNLVTTSNISAIGHLGSQPFGVNIDTITVNGSVADPSIYNLFGSTSVKAYTVGSSCTVTATNVTVTGIATEM